MKRIISLARTATVMAGVATLSAATAGAQQTGRWESWLGCWSSAAPAGVVASTDAPIVCIVPTADANVVQVATITGGKVLSTQKIDASGRDLPVEAKGCTGTQRSQFSADGRRVYLKAVADCGGVERITSGILAMTPSGEWLDVQGVAAGGGEGVRVARYRDAGLPSSVPDDIAIALQQRGSTSRTARLAAGANIGTTAVIEASRSASPAVVEAWLLERGQAFALDARELVALADAGVPARVTDAMVAVSNPGAFGVARTEPAVRSRALDEDDVVGRRISVYMDPVSPFGWGYSPYGYGRYGYGSYGYGFYGYSPYGANSYGGYGYPGYYPPVIVVNPSQQPARGRAVKGGGYTQRGTSTGTNRATPRESSTSTNSGSSSASPSSSPSPRSEPAPSEPRTAHPRP